MALGSIPSRTAACVERQALVACVDEALPHLLPTGCQLGLRIEDPSQGDPEGCNDTVDVFDVRRPDPRLIIHVQPQRDVEPENIRHPFDDQEIEAVPKVEIATGRRCQSRSHVTYRDSTLR